jgi:hypothetical protein
MIPVLIEWSDCNSMACNVKGPETTQLHDCAGRGPAAPRDGRKNWLEISYSLWNDGWVAYALHSRSRHVYWLIIIMQNLE